MEASHKDARRILKYQVRVDTYEHALDDFLNHKWVSSRPKHRKFLGPIKKTSKRMKNAKNGQFESEDDEIFASLVIFDNEALDSDSESTNSDDVRNATTKNDSSDLDSDDEDQIIIEDSDDENTEIRIVMNDENEEIEE